MESRTYCEGYYRSEFANHSVVIDGDKMIPYIEANWTYKTVDYIEAFDRDGNYLGIVQREKSEDKLEKHCVGDDSRYLVLLIDFKFYKFYTKERYWTIDEMHKLERLLNKYNIGNFTIHSHNLYKKFKSTVYIGNSYSVYNMKHSNILKFDYKSFLSEKKRFIKTVDEDSIMDVEQLFDETIKAVAEYYCTEPIVVKRSDFNPNDFMIKRLHKRITEEMRYN